MCRMFGTILYSFYGHGQASSGMMDLNNDLIDLCMASGDNEQGSSIASCMSSNVSHDSLRIVLFLPVATLHRIS